MRDENAIITQLHRPKLLKCGVFVNDKVWYSMCKQGDYTHFWKRIFHLYLQYSAVRKGEYKYFSVTILRENNRTLLMGQYHY